MLNIQTYNQPGWKSDLADKWNKCTPAVEVDTSTWCFADLLKNDYYSSFPGKTSGDNHLTHHETRYNWNRVDRRHGPRYGPTPKVS